MMSSDEFVSQVCDAFKRISEKASGVTLEGREREFRRGLAQHLFDEMLGWEKYSKVGEIYDIACFDDEGFPLIIVETKWGVELTPEIKEKLRRRIEELGSVKYGVFASEREFIVYVYEDYELGEITKINVAEAVGVAKKEFGLSEVGKRRILKLETLKKERLLYVEEPDYFKETYKEVSVAKGEGVKLLVQNLKDIVRDLTVTLMNFFDSYWKRSDYSGRFSQNVFNDWLKMSMKDEEFRRGDEKERQKIIEVFCRETAYVLVGRILFVRMCEDKGILEPNLSGKRLAEFLRFYGRRIENAYLRVFYDSREEIKRYYSHLHELGYFDWWWISPDKIGLLAYDDRREQDKLEEDLNHQIKKCLRRLNRFDFTEVNRDILGDVYQGYLPSDERKRLGEFYTPKEVIEYILDAVGYKPENEIRGKKILDPACGSGGFLVEATQRLIERYRRIGFNLKDPDDTKQIIDGCINSIYGLDIHPFACFIAEMNLLFQLVDLYDTIRQKDKYYELPRLNIYRTDSLMPLGEPIKLTEFLDNSRRVALIEETKGADKVKGVTFDYIVGNPPYVRIQRLEEVKDYYRKVYECAYGRFDIYVLFIERGIKWLKDGGILGYICSDQFMNRDYGEKLRSFVLSFCSINQIIDFGDSGVFKDVTNYPCIFIVEKGIKDINIFNCTKVIKSKDNLLDDIKENLAKERQKDPCYELFRVDKRTLSQEIWKLTPKEEVNLLDKILKFSPLQEISEEIFAGLESGKDTIYFIKKDLFEKLEKDLLKPLLKGKNVRKYKIHFGNEYVIYPYEIKDDKVIEIPEENLRSLYPNVWNYLIKYKEALEKRKWFGKRPKEMGKQWYALMWESNPKGMESQRIIVPRISTMNSFSLENGLHYGNTEVYSIILKEEIRDKYEYILGLLNSKLLEFFMKNISPILSGRYYRYDKQFLGRLPIKIPLSFEEERTAYEISQKVNQILELNEQIEILKSKMEKFPKSYFDDSWSFDRLADVAKVHLSKSSYKISEKKIRTYSFKELEYPFREVSRIILATKEHIDFYSEEVASYVFEVLKTLDRITRRELLELKIPIQPHLKNLMDQYRKDKEQIVKNEEAVKELEKQIDDSVYKLYNITYTERRVIEEYLTKF